MRYARSQPISTRVDFCRRNEDSKYQRKRHESTRIDGDRHVKMKTPGSSGLSGVAENSCFSGCFTQSFRPALHRRYTGATRGGLRTHQSETFRSSIGLLPFAYLRQAIRLERQVGSTSHRGNNPRRYRMASRSRCQNPQRRPCRIPSRGQQQGFVAPRTSHYRCIQ